MENVAYRTLCKCTGNQENAVLWRQPQQQKHIDSRRAMVGKDIWVQRTNGIVKWSSAQLHWMED